MAGIDFPGSHGLRGVKIARSEVASWADRLVGVPCTRNMDHPSPDDPLRPKAACHWTKSWKRAVILLSYGKPGRRCGSDRQKKKTPPKKKTFHLVLPTRGATENDKRYMNADVTVDIKRDHFNY